LTYENSAETGVGSSSSMKAIERICRDDGDLDAKQNACRYLDVRDHWSSPKLFPSVLSLGGYVSMEHSRDRTVFGFSGLYSRWGFDLSSTADPGPRRRHGSNLARLSSSRSPPGSKCSAKLRSTSRAIRLRRSTADAIRGVCSSA